jgi:phenylacetate-coenzyme A ligase PaaK-like adenylate-forming protein
MVRRTTLASKIKHSQKRAFISGARSLLKPSAIRKLWTVEREARKTLSEAEIHEAEADLMEFAVKNCPFYRKCFPARIREIGLLELQDFPPLTKNDLRINFADLLARDGMSGRLGSDNIYLRRTSGSTGFTTSHLQSESERRSSLVFFRRLFRELGLPWRGCVLDVGLRQPGQGLVEARSGNGLWVAWNLEKLNMKNPYTVEQYVGVLSVIRPDLIAGTPSRLNDVARVCSELSYTLRPKVVISAFEPTTKAVRATLTDTFNCRVVSVYGTMETGPVAWECAHGKHHLDPGAAVPEVVNDEGLVESDGNLGRLLLTSLRSRVMPLIRYDTGDLASLGRGRCGCGKSGVWIDALEGRVVSEIRTASGRRLHAYCLMARTDDLGIREYQYIQRMAGEVTLVVEPWTHIDSDLVANLQDDFSAFLKEQFRINLDNSGDFIYTENGKRNPVCVELNT